MISSIIPNLKFLCHIDYYYYNNTVCLYKPILKGKININKILFKRIVFALLGFKPRALYFQGKLSATKLHIQSLKDSYFKLLLTASKIFK